ncbi:hypothetical protein [Daejeonella sp.]|uniref:hypothetical protein n=1 Tax=Daejeonella sp. TaxID=2805397 RepID=UPI00271FF113|nr:hypothetical protein [Daejeonella sp.]MDO8992255.1 hypothetical protein [Daejeonella sp.]MDP2414072.1 hypothetical protein [Daejeonella sp.]
MEIIEVLLNGQKVCRAGISSKQSSYGAIINLAASEGRPSLINLDVSGLNIEKSEHLHWFNSNLEFNDEVTIRIIDSTLVDEPTKRYSVDEGKQHDLENKLQRFYKLREELKDHIKD